METHNHRLIARTCHPSLGVLRQEDQEFKAIVGSAWATLDPVSKKKRKPGRQRQVDL